MDGLAFLLFVVLALAPVIMFFMILAYVKETERPRAELRGFEVKLRDEERRGEGQLER